MLNQIATSNRVQGKGLNFKKFSGKCWALVCASLLISVSTQATHPEFEDSSFDQNGNFYTSTGKLIKPWDQPKELRQAKELGLDEVQTLINNSALRIAQYDNGDFVLHLHGRLRGGVRGLPGCYCPLAPNCDNLCQVRRQALSRLARTGQRSGNSVPNFVPQVVITPAPRRPQGNPLQLGLTRDGNRPPAHRPLRQQEMDAHQDQLITNTVTNKLKKNPNTLILFKEKKSSWKKKELEEFNGAWDKKIGQKVKGSRHYKYSRNSKGDMTLKDLRRGIVYPIFAEDRQNTDCYLPQDYPKRTKDYSARDTDLGAWLLNRYTEYKLPLNEALIGGVGKSFKGPFHRVLSEPKHRTTKPMLATFGIVSNKMGPGGFRKLSLQVKQSDRDLSNLLFEAHQWLGLFENPKKYFKLSMEHPIAQFKGTTITRSHIPKAIRYEVWPKTMKNFKNSLAGTSSLQDHRNGLCYPLYSVNYSNTQAMLPRGYEPSVEQGLLGAAFLQATGSKMVPVLEKVLGIPSMHTVRGVQALESAGGLQSILRTSGGVMGGPLRNLAARSMVSHLGLVLVTGLAVDNLFNDGELTKGVGRLLSDQVDVWRAAKNAMDVANWITKDQGFAGFDSDRMEKFITYGIVGETQLETFPIEDRVEIRLTTPGLDEGEIRGSILTWELPEDTWNKITAKIPEGWEGPIPTEKKNQEGFMWIDGSGGNIRVMKGRPTSPYQCQQRDYVKVSIGGKVVFKDGSSTNKKVDGVNPSRKEEAHIPLSEEEAWENWELPNAPKK